MPSPQIQAPPDAVARLRHLQELEKAAEGRKLARLDVFAKIGYEPNCDRRYQVRKRVAARLGLDDPFDPSVAQAAALPDPCGKCPQELFHAATEFDVLYGGAAGGGKSLALVAEGLKVCARYAGIRVLLLRRSYDELEESIFPGLRKFGMAKAVGGRWNGVKHQVTFANGSLFRFRYLERVDDAARRQGGEYQLLLVDELTLMAPGIVDYIRYERIRAGGASTPVIGIRATSNPGGVGHGEVKARYIEATDKGAKVATDDHGLTVRFIPAKASDNPHLDAGYEARLDAIPDPERRAAMRHGDWDRFAGMMFPEFSDARHMLEPIALPESWRRYNGVDWGFAAPWAVLWAAVDEDKRAWVYRELYATQVGEADQARMILEAEAGEEVIARWADDAMWATRGDAKPIADVYADNGVHLTKSGKGPGSRVQGWQRWHSYMKEMPACAHHRAAGWETCPRVHIFTTCPNLRSELKALPHATTGDPEDADPKAADHAADAGRYLLLNIDGGATFYDSPEPPPRGPGELLTPMGAWAVREDPAVIAARAARDPQHRQGATQTWEEALAAMSR